MTETSQKDSPPHERMGDNLLALSIGILQVIFSFLGEYFGISVMLGLLIVASVTSILSIFIYYFFKDVRAVLVLCGLGSFAALLIILLSSADGRIPHVPPKLSLSVTVYLDENQNRVKDGTEKFLSGINVVVLDEHEQDYTRQSNAQGVTEFRISPSNTMQIVVCGIAQSHTIAARPQNHVTIGVEASELQNCG